MKKLLTVALAGMLCLASLTACGDTTSQETTNDTNSDVTSEDAKTQDEQETQPSTEETETGEEAKSIDTLHVYFVPSREPEEIVTATEPLKEMLKDELLKQGYNVGDVEISVGNYL